MNRSFKVQDHALEGFSDSEILGVEDRLWWQQGRKSIIKEYLKRVAKFVRAPLTIVDVGCGTGGNFDVLGRLGKVIGVERSENLARCASQRGGAETVLQLDVAELSNCEDVGLFTMFDVLEHIENDTSCVAQLQMKGATEHFLLVSVPACPFLYCEHDRILHHFRRYTTKALRATLEEGGYRIVHMSHFMFFLFPLVLCLRVKDKILSGLGKPRPTVEIGALPPFFSVLFMATLRMEAILSRWVRFPIGLWLFALAEKNSRREVM